MKLIGQGNIYNNKVYSVADSNAKGYKTPSMLNLPDNWYGGMVKKIFTSKDGVYILCDKKDNVINIGIPETIEVEEVNKEIKVEEVKQDVPIDNLQKAQILCYETMELHELKEIADSKGIEYFKNAKKEKMIELLTQAL